MQLVLSPHYHYLFYFGISNPRKCQYAFYLNILNWRYISCSELFVVGAVIGIIGMILITISITTLGDNLLFMLANVIVALILTIVEWVILVKIFNRKIPFWIKLS